jgi:hypothetical protein
LPGRRRRPRQIRLPSPFAQAVLLVIGAVALVLFVLQLTATRPNEFGDRDSAPDPSVATSQNSGAGEIHRP